MEISWIDPEHPAVADVAGAVAVNEAARLVDCPHQLSTPEKEFVEGVRHGWDGEPAATAVARNSAGTVIAVLGVGMPGRDNRHLGQVCVTVDPLFRRCGIGTELFSIAVDRIRNAGRNLAVSHSWEHSAGVPFAKSVGLERVSVEVMRRQDLRTVDHARIARLAAQAGTHACQYELLRLPGPVPDDMMDAIVDVTGAINDAPTDDLDVEDEVFSPERIRAFEAALDAYGRRTYRLVARHRSTGAPAGHTMVVVSIQHPWQAWQADTSVVRSHRGHRLGILLKAEMIGWLRQAEPQLHRLDTWNAASNPHMIGINEQLGYQVVARGIGWQRRL